MAVAAAVELDFFGMESKEEEEAASTNPPPKNRFHRRRSFRDIQSVISKLNPELLKAVIATGSASVDHTSSLISKNSSSSSVPSTPKHHHKYPFPFPAAFSSRSNSTCGGNSENMSPPHQTAPLTIFYNGTVTVFNVHPHNAENILLKLAEGGVSKMFDGGDGPQLLQKLHGDLPIARRKSLQRFLEKRKHRLTRISPYGLSAKNATTN